MQTLGGYRLIRKLGEGARAEVWLGHSATPGSQSGTAVKLFRAAVSLRSINEEIEVLARVSSAHLVELVDIASADDGRPCLVLRRVPQGSLEQLGALRQHFSVGELVTALAPVATAVAELHRLGIAHGSLRAAAVMLDERRAPVLACFGAATLIGDAPADATAQSLTSAQSSSDPQIAADLAALTALVRSFVVRSDDPATCESLARWLGTHPTGEGVLAELTDRLYGLAAAAPLGQATSVLAAESRPFRVLPPTASTTPATLISTKRSLRDAALAVVERALIQDPVATLMTRLRGLAASVRRPVWIAAGLGFVALVVAVGVVPTLGGSPSAVVTPVEDARAPHPTATVARTDDPIAAARQLVAARAECITARSVACLDTVDQADSAASEADRYFVRQLQLGSTATGISLDASQLTLVERLGDSAIIGLGNPTFASHYPGSLLIVKVEAGWRIRDLTTGISP